MSHSADALGQLVERTLGQGLRTQSDIASAQCVLSNGSLRPDLPQDSVNATETSGRGGNADALLSDGKANTKRNSVEILRSWRVRM